jgi:hypothetical protein
MNDLAAIRWSLGDLQGARELREQTLAARRQVVVETTPYSCLDEQPRCNRRDLDDLQGAYELHEQALAAARRRVLGEEEPPTR